MQAQQTWRIGLVITATLAVAACGRSQRLGSVAKDSGTGPPDGGPARDGLAADGAAAQDAAADAPLADAVPDLSNLDRASVRSDAAPADEVAAPDLVVLGLGGADADAAMVDGDARPDASRGRRDTAEGGVVLEAGADGGGPQPCTGTFMLGGFLPMGKTGGTPSSVALGDLNGDGKLDLVTGNVVSSTVSVLLGKGSGTFAAKTDYTFGSPHSTDPTRARPSMVALGDLNGDGKLDIAVAQDSGYSAVNTVVVLLGKGDGTFPTRASYPAEPGASSVALGDMDGDGRMDVVVANYLWNSVTVTSGSRADGGVSCDTGGGPGTVVLGDLNGDGKLDLVTVNVLAGSLSVLLGEGDGTCASRLDVPIGRDSQSQSSSAALGDVNGDGKLDLVVATSSPSTVTVLLGKGDGTFVAPSDYPAGDGPVLVALRDLDGDRKLDILVATSATGTVSVLPGKGDGTFAAKVDYPGVRGVRSAALGDLDGDGNLDLAMAGPITLYWDVGWTSVLFGMGRGTFVGRPSYPTGIDPSAMALADLDGDGKLDVAAVGSRTDATGAAAVLLGGGDGTFAVPVHFATGDHPSSLALADLNDDDAIDLVAANREAASASVLLGVGDGTFAARVDYPTADRPSSVALADVDGDGLLDMATVGFDARNRTNSRPVTASVLLGSGGGRFAAHVDYALVGGSALTPQSLALGDLDGDGQVDIAVAPDTNDTTEPGPFDILLGNGDGTFADDGYSYYWPPVNSVLLMDLNGDRSLDIVAASTSGNDGQGRVAVSLGKGDGTFDSPWPTSLTAGYGARWLALGDMNQDGNLDVITGNLNLSQAEAPGTVSVLLGNGDGTFAPGLEYPAAAVSLALGDVNRDGRLEVVTATPTGALEVLSSSCR
jgi:hypothetical protein